MPYRLGVGWDHAAHYIKIRHVRRMAKTHLGA